MGKLDRRSLWLLLGLLIILVILAILFDLRLPRGRPLDLPSRDLPLLSPPLVELAQRTRGLGMLVRLLAALTTTAGVGIFMLAVIPQRLQRAVEALRSGNIGLSLSVGVATLLGGTLLIILAIISVFAAPFVVLISVGLSLIVALGAIVSALGLGQWLRQHISQQRSLLADLLTGVLLLGFPLLLPVGRSIVLLVIITAGIGALLLTRLGSEF